MITSLYAGILAIWICYLSIQVIKQRRKHRISHADGQVDDLAIARGAHSNATEYVPIGLLLLMLAEFNGAPQWSIHILGALLVIGRLSHGLAVLSRKMKGRVFGMLSTFGVIGLLAIFNMVRAFM